jgi:hypothetical protein
MLNRSLKRSFTWGEFFPNRNLYVGAGQKYNTRYKDFWQQHQTYGREAHEHSYTHTAADYKIHRPWDTAKFWLLINIKQQWDFFSYRYLRTLDLCTMALLPASTATFAILGAAFFKPLYVYSVVSAAAWYYRVRDRVSHPEYDELGIKDLLYANETISKYVNDKSAYVIDVHQEYDRFNLQEFPEYGKSALARFFNVDCNTTTGYLKMCDLETDARLTVHFKTMPWSDEKFACTHPFLLTSLWAEINCKGVIEKVVLIDPAKVNKRPFVIL